MTTKTDEQIRADFEAWFKETDHFLSELDFCLMPDGRYEDDDVEVAWEAYQAGRAALQSQTGSIVSTAESSASLMISLPTATTAKQILTRQ